MTKMRLKLFLNFFNRSWKLLLIWKLTWNPIFLSFILFSGFWSRHVGEISQPPVAVPIHPAEHYHLHTKPVPDLPPDTPVVRDPDAFIYFRENEGRFLAGGFEPIVRFFILFLQMLWLRTPYLALWGNLFDGEERGGGRRDTIFKNCEY